MKFIYMSNHYLKKEWDLENSLYVTFKLRMRVEFQLVPPYPEDTRGKLKYYFHHVSICDETTGKTLFTITDQPLTQNLQ